MPGRQLDGRSRRVDVRVVCGQLLLQRGAGAVRDLPRQLDLVGGHERQLARNLHLRRRLQLVGLRRQPRVQLPRRVRRDRDELLAVRSRLLLADRRLDKVHAVRFGHVRRLARRNVVHGLPCGPVDRVRRRCLVRGVRVGFLLERRDLQGLPGQLDLPRRQLLEQLRVQPGLRDVGLGQLSHLHVRARNVLQRDVVELRRLPRGLVLVDRERGFVHAVRRQHLFGGRELH